MLFIYLKELLNLALPIYYIRDYFKRHGVRLEKKLLNFAHHYEFEESGLKIDDIKKLIHEKRVMYDHSIDQKGHKWSGVSTLTRIPSELLPSYLNSNLSKYKDWLD